MAAAAKKRKRKAKPIKAGRKFRHRGWTIEARGETMLGFGWTLYDRDGNLSGGTFNGLDDAKRTVERREKQKRCSARGHATTTGRKYGVKSYRGGQYFHCSFCGGITRRMTPEERAQGGR